MKSTKNERAVKKDEYPCLKTDAEGMVILFSDIEIGVVVATGSRLFEIGDYAEDWSEHNFTTYHGTITLEN